MSARDRTARALTLAGLAVAGVMAVVGGITLYGSGAAALLLAGGVAGCLGAGTARQSPGGSTRRATADAAWRTAAGTVGCLLVLCGTAALGGAPLTSLVLASAAVVGLGVWVFRTRRGHRAAAATGGAGAAGARPPLLVPVVDLSTDALGREWMRSAGALAAALEPGTRQHVVRRRQETLDELERRDPEGFARWLIDGAHVDSDPADWVCGGDPATGHP